MITTTLLVLAVGSTILLSAACIATRLIPNSSAASRFSIWQIAVASLLLLPPGILFLPNVPLGLTFSRPTITSNPSNVGRRQPLISSPIGLTPGTANLDFNSSPSSLNDSTIANSPADVTRPSNRLLASSKTSQPQVSAAQITFTIWLAIAFVLLSRTLVSHLRSALQSAPTNFDASSHGRVRPDWFPKSIDIAYCGWLNVPVTTGIWRKRILLPTTAYQWSTDEFRMVLRHELAHVNRRDVLWQLITSITIDIFWFQPMAWWANRQLKLERERACDDQVIARGEHPADYATVLVNLAAAFSGRKIIPSGALSMAQKPIEQRIETILSPSTNRASTNRWLGGLATTICLIIVIGASSIRPFSLANASTPSTPPISKLRAPENGDLDFPKLLTGRVVDEHENPVVDAELHLTATPRPKFEAYHFDYTHATVRLPVVKTDGEGKYSLDISDLKNGKDIWSIHGKVVAANFPAAPFYKTLAKGKNTSLAIRTIAIQPGKTIAGRIIPPANSNNHALINPVIRVSPIGMAPSNKWLGESVKCQSDGRFSVIVARDVRVSIQATADNFAGVGFEVQPQARDLNDIQLQSGQKLKGKLVDRAGRPVPGILVFSDTDYGDNRNHWNGPYPYQPHFRRHCKTNMNGEFELAPQAGKVRVSLRSSIFDFNTHANLTSDRIPPVVVPLQIDFANPEFGTFVELQEADTVQASGVVRWPDGSPAIGLEATVSLMIGSSSIDVYKTKTDSRGKYVALIPKNMRSHIGVLGARDSSNKWLFATASTKSKKAFQQGSQILGLNPLLENVSGLDWKLSQPKLSSSGTTKPTGAQKKTEAELKRLLAKIRSDAASGRLRIVGAIDDQEKQKLKQFYQHRDQANSANLVSFEAKHRGEFLGAVALANYLDYKEPNQLDEFAANYIDSPNADAILGDIFYQGNFAHTRKILQTFASDSPHPNVKTNAMFQQAALIAQAIQQKEYFKNPEWHPIWPEPKNPEEKAQLAKYRSILTELMSLDSSHLVAEFDTILKTLKTKYPEHGSLVRNWAGERLKERCTELAGQPYADQLQEFQFQMKNLRSGQPLPRLTGHDVHGGNFDSDRFKGKAVLLFFTSNQYVDRENFKKLRELKKHYSGRPFEIVSVMVDLKRDEATTAVDSGKITWPTLYDEGQQLMHKWQFTPCSDRLLIDHEGVIQRRAMYRSDFDATIKRLVENAERHQK